MAASVTLNMWRSGANIASGVPNPNNPLVHGSTVSITGSFGTNTTEHNFTKSLVEAASLGSTPVNANNFIFNNSLGTPLTVVVDSVRGKVLQNTQDSSNYNSAIRYRTLTPIDVNEYTYCAFWTKVRLQVSGADYTGGFQLKNMRWNFENSIVDNTNCDLKNHTQYTNPTSTLNQLMIYNNGSNHTVYGGLAPNIDNTWFLYEIFMSTGTVGGNNSRVVVRTSQTGTNRIVKNTSNITLYGGTDRFEYFIEQAYLGNWTVAAPDVREVWKDSSSVIRSWKRVDLCDTLDTQSSTYRQNQNWSTWNGDITLNLDTTGLSVGNHTLYLRVIDGVDSSGWDNVVGYKVISVQK